VKSGHDTNLIGAAGELDTNLIGAAGELDTNLIGVAGELDTNLIGVAGELDTNLIAGCRGDLKQGGKMGYGGMTIMRERKPIPGSGRGDLGLITAECGSMLTSGY
jgi:hypothetical protein